MNVTPKLSEGDLFFNFHLLARDVPHQSAGTILAEYM